MILGVGTDLCDISRIENCLMRYPNRFENRLFHPIEIEHNERSKGKRVSRYAMQFAAKEAAAKALGTGMLRENINWHSFEIHYKTSGQPWIKLNDIAAHKADSMCPTGYTHAMMVSMSDDGNMAQAFAILWAKMKSSRII